MARRSALFIDLLLFRRAEWLWISLCHWRCCCLRGYPSPQPPHHCVTWFDRPVPAPVAIYSHSTRSRSRTGEEERNGGREVGGGTFADVGRFVVCWIAFRLALRTVFVPDDETNGPPCHRCVACCVWRRERKPSTAWSVWWTGSGSGTSSCEDTLTRRIIIVISHCMHKYETRTGLL